ncbi:MAG: hypothetical protein SVV03_02680 [Candidatus Nanohaloarchaea archaeon]|nr:hypothetical protein [Candidatus Nanohaloarchaea archaeon]
MAEDFDKEMLNFLVQSYRSSVAHIEGYAESLDKVEERLYGIVSSEDWGELGDFIEEKEEELDIQLKEMRDFVETMDEEDVLETDDEDLIGDIPKSTYQALKLKAKSLDGQEAIAYTDKSVRIDDLWELEEDIYDTYGKKLFVVSAQKQWNGRISVELSDTRQKFEVFKVYEDSNGELHYRHFGQSVPNKGYNVKEAHTEGFFVYKFKQENVEYLLFSREKLSPMRCRITGTHFKINDRTEIGENRTLPTNQDVIFVKDVEPAITKIPEEELDAWKEKADHDYLAEKLHGGFRHPTWFERLTQALIFVNEDFGWPSHLFWFGPTSTGKSFWLQGLNKAMDCPAGIYSGTGSTVKGLTPSFKAERRPPPRISEVGAGRRVYELASELD